MQTTETVLGPRTQIFGWTEPETPAEGYAAYCMVFDLGDGRFELETRNREGAIAAVRMPAGAALQFAHEIGQRAVLAD